MQGRSAMICFLELTHYYAKDPVSVNINHLTYFCPDPDGRGTVLVFTHDSEMIVSERYDDVHARLKKAVRGEN